jgi:hypothetical protein
MNVLIIEGVVGGDPGAGRIIRAIRYLSLVFLVLYEDSQFGLDLNRGWHWMLGHAEMSLAPNSPFQGLGEGP